MRKLQFMLLVFVLAISGLAQGQNTYVLLSEDFEGLALGPNVEEGTVGEEVWTETPPDGWYIDESGVPGVGDPSVDGVTEWAGWAFADKEWWTSAAGDQNRSEFTLGIGTVAIADGDEWDDAAHPADYDVTVDAYDTWLSTPALDISAARPGTIVLTFDSSWRPEYDSDYHQTANITVSFDGGDPTELLLWESDSSSSNYKEYATNETVTLEIPNPAGATNMVITFGYFDAGNDWWWAIDNVVITAERTLDLAYNPSPESGDVEVPIKTVLTWTPGAYVGAASPKHRVSLSDDYDAVSNGSAVVSTQDANSYDATGMLDFEATYYWRIDEANGASWDEGVIWSFTVESMTYPIEIVTATSNCTSDEGKGPENAVNGSGLTGDTHSTLTTDMWNGKIPENETPYVQFEFDGVYKLYEMFIWNYNMDFEAWLGIGIKNVAVEYSQDGTDWTSFGDVELNQGPGSNDYTYNTTIAFDGIAAKYVRLTINSTWLSATDCGLSEVAFSYIPAQARLPKPEDGAADVSVNTLLSWNAGREAVSHEVYLGTDPNALDRVATTTQSSYAATDLDLGTTYAWQIVEVNEADAVSAWPGAIWTFTTEAYLVIDDFESYIDDSEVGDAIWEAWVDGLVAYGGDAANGGSVVGHDTSPFAEQNIVHTGKQSMPLYFSNGSASAISEADYAFGTAQDWTASGIKSLTFWFYGAEGNTGRLYAKINGTKVDYDGPAVNIARPSWQPWSIDLSAAGNVGSVTSLSIGIEGTGDGVIYIDDIRLYPEVLDYLSPDITGAGDTVQGVPNDADWPSAEYPSLAIDDDVTTKFLHYKGGETTTGIQIAPLVGSTVVTGLTFTSANDAPNRDPITFELSGSNTGIDGPYTLITSGDIADFAGTDAWERLTKTETPIEFDNTTAYTYYQITFPTIRGTANDYMQIAEIELLGTIQ